MHDPILLRDSTPRNALLLKDLLTALRLQARKKRDRPTALLLTSKSLIQKAGLQRTTELHLARLGTMDKRTLDREDHRRLVDYLWSHGFIDGSREIVAAVQASPDTTYHALASWLGSEKADVAELARRTSGRFRYWRPWGVGLRYVAVGVLEFKHNPGSQTLMVEESRGAPGVGTERLHSQRLTGFVFGDRQRMFGLLANRSAELVSFISLTGISRDGRFVALSGVCGGFSDGDHMIAPLYAEADGSGSEQPLDDTGIVPVEEVPWIVRERLTGARSWLRLGPVADAVVSDDGGSDR